MTRIAVSYLRARFARCADDMGWDHVGPAWSRNAAGENVAKVGYTFLEKNYGGWRVCQMVNEGGGERTLTEVYSARELDGWFSGLQMGKMGHKN